MFKYLYGGGISAAIAIWSYIDADDLSTWSDETGGFYGGIAGVLIAIVLFFKTRKRTS